MGMWFNKKEGNKETNLPQLPELPRLPELPSFSNISEEIPANSELPEAPEIKDELPSLPMLPSSKIGEKMGEEVIKSEISKEKLKPYTREVSSGHFRTESSDGARESAYSRQKSERRTLELPFKPSINPIIRSARQEFTSRANSSERNEPIFVRIDKFQAALKNFSEIKQQLNDIESYLEEIKSIRAKEDQELGEWEHEITDIKAKLESIDRGVFSKLE